MDHATDLMADTYELALRIVNDLDGGAFAATPIDTFIKTVQPDQKFSYDLINGALTEYILFDADIKGHKGALGLLADTGNDCPKTRLARSLSNTAVFSQFTIKSQSPDADTAILVNPKNKVEYTVFSPLLAHRTDWTGGAVACRVGFVDPAEPCRMVSIVPLHDNAPHPDLYSCDFINFCQMVIGKSGIYTASAIHYTAEN